MIKLSVVIGVRNRDKELANCLYSLKHQTISADHFEIVLVNYGGTNEAKKLIQKCGIKNYQYFYVDEKGIFNESRAKNIGIRKSKGKFVLCTNADIVFSSELLKSALLVAESQKKKCLLTKNRIELENEIQPRDRNRLVGFNSSSIRKLEVGPDSAMGDFQLAEKSIFTMVRGYDERMVGWGAMDIDLSMRMKDNGVKLIRMSAHEYPILHQRHERNSDPSIKHNLNLMLISSNTIYNPLDNWGKIQKKYKLIINSTFLHKNSKNLILGKINQKKYSILFTSKPYKIVKNSIFDGIIEFYSEAYHNIDDVVEIIRKITQEVDIFGVQSVNKQGFEVVGYSPRSYILLFEKYGEKMPTMCKYLLSEFCKKYAFSNKLITNSKAKEIKNKLILKSMFNYLYYKLFWLLERNKSIV